MDSDLFRLLLDTGLLLEQSKDLSVDHKPGVNISGRLRLSAERCSGKQEVSPAGPSVSCSQTILESKPLPADYNLPQSSSWMYL